jgi:hypothetical protein
MCNPKRELENAWDSVTDFVGDTFDWVVDEVVKPVVDTVESVVKGMLDDPIKTLAQITAVATGNTWALPLIEGADVAIAGGDIGDVLTATAKAYVAQELGSAAGKFGATEAAKITRSQAAGRIAGSAAASTAAGIVYGRDPIESLKTGLISAGSAELVNYTLGAIDQKTGGNLAKLENSTSAVDRAAAAAIKSAVNAQVTGQDVTAATLSAIMRSSEIVTNVMSDFNKDNQYLTPEQATLAADILTNITAAAFAGRDPSQALQATLMKVGSQALGDLATDGFKKIIDDVKYTYNVQEVRASAVEKSIEKYGAAADVLNNSIRLFQENYIDPLDARYEVYSKALKAYEANPNSTTEKTLRDAVNSYNVWAKYVDDSYKILEGNTINPYKQLIEKYETEYESAVVAYQESQKELSVKLEPLQAKYSEAYSNTAKAFVEVMDPNFKADEYKQINNLGGDVDVYEHWLTQGQYEGLKTNQKDVAVSEALNRYEQAFGEPPPEYILGKLIDPTNANRDKATELFVDTKIKDQEKQGTFRKAVSNKVFDAYREEGLNDAQIRAKIDSGEATSYVNSIVDQSRNSIASMQDYTRAVAEKYGTDSAEYKEAYRNTLDAMAEIGGYGVVKDGNDFVVDNGVKINPDTLTASYEYVVSGKSWTDPVTGKLHAEIIGTSDPTEQERTYSALFALGQSANPPEQGGESVFGDGSGATPGLFGGLTPIAVDANTGGTLYGGDDGFALIAYADGRGAAINTKTNEVIWVTPEKTKEILQKTPIAEPVKPIEAKPDAPTPEPPPPVTKPIDTVITEIKDKVQSPADVKKVFESLGYKNPTDQEIKQFAGEKTADKLLQELTPYVDQQTVDADEAREALKQLGIENPSQKDIEKLIGQYAESQLAGKAGALDIQELRYNSLLDQIKQVTGGATSPELEAKLGALTTEQQELARQLAAQGVDLQTAIDTAAADISRDVADKFGTLTAEQKSLANQLTQQGVDLNTAINTVRGELGGQIAGVSADVQAKYDALTAEQKALANQLTQQGVDLNTAINTVRGELQTQIGATQDQIAEVAGIVGKPYRDVTQADIDFVQGIINQQQTQPETVLTPGQLAYDANQDGRIDQSDLEFLQNVVGGVGTQPFTPAPGTIWAQQPTGIYGVLAEQEAAARERDAAQRAQAARLARQTQQRQNVNTLQQLLMGAPDIGGQQVTVKAPDPAQIGYIYDWSSIFANPQQEKMFITPYAEGGMVEDDDAVTAELLKILRS